MWYGSRLAFRLRAKGTDVEIEARHFIPIDRDQNVPSTLSVVSHLIPVATHSATRRTHPA